MKKLALMLVAVFAIASSTASASSLKQLMGSHPSVAKETNLLRHATTGTSRGPVGIAHAARTNCFSSSSNERWWAIGGHKIGWIAIYQDGFCGDGHRISRDNGWYARTWAWGPYCFTNISKHWGWLQFPTWKHGGIWASLGFNYPWGCGGLRSGAATTRIAATGYQDWRY